MKKMNPDFDVRLYGNELLDRYADDPYVKLLISMQEPWAFVLDRIRCLLLRDEGGIWLDPDCQPVRPLSRLNHVWDGHFTFAHGFRSPYRKDVALHRGVTLLDDTFLASAKDSRVINRVLEAWSQQRPVVDGHGIGCQIMQYTDADVCALNYRYFYAVEAEPETLVLHDKGNLGSWVEQQKAKSQRQVTTINIVRAHA